MFQLNSLARISRLNRRSAGGFVLLEVIVAMVILGIAIATMMRSFTISLDAIRRNDVSTQATVLAETLLQSLEAEPPEAKKRLTGSFESDGFPRFGYEVESTSEKIKYRLKTNTRVDDLRELQIVRLNMTYENSRGENTIPVDAYLVLAPLERFSYESKFYNELFSEEEGI